MLGVDLRTHIKWVEVYERLDYVFNMFSFYIILGVIIIMWASTLMKKMATCMIRIWICYLTLDVLHIRQEMRKMAPCMIWICYLAIDVVFHISIRSGCRV